MTCRRPFTNCNACVAFSPAAGRVIGPRPASHAAQMSAGTVTPGTNQVQSIAEWTPKTTTTASIVSRPARSSACSSVSGALALGVGRGRAAVTEPPGLLLVRPARGT